LLLKYLDENYNKQSNKPTDIDNSFNKSIVSESENGLINFVRIFFLVSSNEQNIKTVICLKFNFLDFDENFLISPQAILLFYDLESKDSFDCVINYYNVLKNNNKFIDTKFFLLGNQKDVVNKENEEEEKGDNNEKDNKEDNPVNNENYYEEVIKTKNFDILQKLSILNSENIKKLLDEIVILFFKSLNSIQIKNKCIYKTEGETTIIENKLEINRQQSYHDDDYKNEVHKINDSTSCCLHCIIF